MDGGARLPFEAWYFDVPIVTRAFITASVLTSIAVVRSVIEDEVNCSNVMWCRCISYFTVGGLPSSRLRYTILLGVHLMIVLACTNDISVHGPTKSRLHISHLLHVPLFPDVRSRIGPATPACSKKPTSATEQKPS